MAYTYSDIPASLTPSVWIQESTIADCGKVSKPIDETTVTTVALLNAELATLTKLGIFLKDAGFYTEAGDTVSTDEGDFPINQAMRFEGKDLNVTPANTAFYQDLVNKRVDIVIFDCANLKVYMAWGLKLELNLIRIKSDMSNGIIARAMPSAIENNYVEWTVTE